MSITTKVVISNPANGEMYSIQHYVIKVSVTFGRSVVFSGYSTNKTDYHDNLNSVESGAKHYNPYHNPVIFTSRFMK